MSQPLLLPACYLQPITPTCPPAFPSSGKASLTTPALNDDGNDNDNGGDDPSPLLGMCHVLFYSLSMYSCISSSQ